MKNAEASIVDKYSSEVKETLNKILEQDEFGAPPPAGGMDPMADDAAPAGDADVDATLGAAEGEELCACPDEGEKTKITEDDSTSDTPDEEADVDYTAGVTTQKGDPEGEEAAAQTADSIAMDKLVGEEINLDSLVDAIMEKFSLDEDDKDSEVQEEATEVDLPDLEKKEDKPEVELKNPSYMQEEEADTDALVDAVMERLTVDMGADLTGWAGRRTEDKKFAMEKELASRRSTGLEQETHLGRGMADRTDTDPQTELEDLKQAQEELVFENSQLNAKLQNYENVVEQLKESVTDVNLSNARLLYTNRVLRNTSLNERQKQKVAEAISKAGSVPEAKTIFETLQSTVESTPKRGPQSLSETINRRSSILRASNHSEAKKADPIADRMKKLAGIN